MKIAQELRQGSTIKIGNDPFIVLKAEYNKSGRNAAVMTEKDIRSCSECIYQKMREQTFGSVF